MRTKIIILIILSVTEMCLFSQNNKIKQYKTDMEKWDKFIKEGNVVAIDSMIDNKIVFAIPKEYINEFKSDKKKDDIYTKIVYYCLRKNMFIANNYNYLNESSRLSQVGSNYLSDSLENIFGNDATYLFALEKRYFNKLNFDSSKQELALKFQQRIDSLETGTESLEEENIKLLEVLNHILNKGYKLNESMLNRLIYADTDWRINPISTIFFFENLYPNMNLFSEDVIIEDYTPERILLSYVSNDNLNIKCLQYLMKIIDMSKANTLCKQMYPIRDTEEWDRDLDETIPTYEAEKILQVQYPTINEYSGHTLLHSAIVNVDISLVQELMRTKQYMLEITTNPIHPYFNEQYGAKPYTPLELAIYTRENLDKLSKGNSFYRTLPYSFKQKQLKKIVNLLNGDPLDKGLVWVLPFNVID